MSYIRNSKYITLPDGCRLAVDIYLPASYEEGNRYPLVLKAGNENRRERFSKMPHFAEELLDWDYALAFVDLRGYGASFGHNQGFFGPSDAQDLKFVIDTLAEEPWCTGKVGMYGGSNNGCIQEVVATAKPEHLSCIIPCDCNPNFYYQNFTNGASAIPVMKNNKDSVIGTKGMKNPKAGAIAAAGTVGAPVDDDIDSSQAREAALEHLDNGAFLSEYFPNMWRDTVNPKLGFAPNLVNSTWTYMDKIRESGIPIYKQAAWYDPGCTGAIIAFRDWGGRLLIGPWRHTEIYRLSHPELNRYTPEITLPNYVFPWEREHLRFFNQYLKGQNEGLENEPPVMYYRRGAFRGHEWTCEDSWPVTGEEHIDIYLNNAASNSFPDAASQTFDGGLSTGEPQIPAVIPYKVREDISLFGRGKLNRMVERDFEKEESKCLTFTSDIQDQPLEITGIPVLTLQVSADYKDANFIAVLEEVTEEDGTFFITDGAMRASHKKITPNPLWDRLNLPYHESLEAEAEWMQKDVPMEITFSMEAISYVLAAGSRLRLCIFCGCETYMQPEGMPADTEVRLHIGGDTQCKLHLPVIHERVIEFSGNYSHGDESREAGVFIFDRNIYFHIGARWEKYAVTSRSTIANVTTYVTDSFTAVVAENENGEQPFRTAAVLIETPELHFDGEGRVYKQEHTLK